MSRHAEYGQPRSLARRLRVLRGTETQEIFSKKIGVSRSALANYETGRSVPSAELITQFSQRLGIAETFLVSGDMLDEPDWFAVMGTMIEGRQDITADEWAILRVLRLCSRETAQKVLADLIEGVTTEGVQGHVFEVFDLREDLERLVEMHLNAGKFERGKIGTEGKAVMENLVERSRKRAARGSS